MRPELFGLLRKMGAATLAFSRSYGTEEESAYRALSAAFYRHK